MRTEDGEIVSFVLTDEKGKRTAVLVQEDTHFTSRVDLDTSAEKELQRCDAFDRETGAHLDIWDLFLCSPEEVKRTLLDLAQIVEQPFTPIRICARWSKNCVSRRLSRGQTYKNFLRSCKLAAQLKALLNAK